MEGTEVRWIPDKAFGDDASRFALHAGLPGDNRALEPPDPIPNSVVKRCIADGSVGSPHVRVGHRQALIQNAPISYGRGVLLYAATASRAGALYCPYLDTHPRFS